MEPSNQEPVFTYTYFVTPFTLRDGCLQVIAAKILAEQAQLIEQQRSERNNGSHGEAGK